jgi:hypothetical protein
LRSKRNHRKESAGPAAAEAGPADAGAAVANTQNGTANGPYNATSGLASSPPNHNPYFPASQTHSSPARQTQPTTGKGSRTITGHPAAGPVPKRPANAFMIFCEASRESVRKTLESDPHYEPSTDYDLHRALASAWAQLKQEGQQKPYYDTYQKHCDEWRERMKEWERRNTYFQTHPEEATEALRQMKEDGVLLPAIPEADSQGVAPVVKGEDGMDVEAEDDEEEDDEEEDEEDDDEPEEPRDTTMMDYDMSDDESEVDMTQYDQAPPPPQNPPAPAPEAL